MPQHIFIVEDDANIAANYRDLLSRYGYQVNVYSDRGSALAACSARLPDLAIIDVGLGDEIDGGFELCRELRAMSAQLPIMFLTARDNEIDAVSGLRLGADDYLTKDISPPHLVARITALFRRSDALRSQPEVDDILNCEQLVLDLNRMSAHWRQLPIPLTLTEFWMVHALAKHPGHVKNRQQLMDAANVVLDDNTITSHIKRIRKKFIHDDEQFNAIETVYGFGYRWNLTLS